MALFGAARTQGERYAIPIHATAAVSKALANDVQGMCEHIVDALEAVARLECDGDPGGSVSASHQPFGIELRVHTPVTPEDDSHAAD